MNRQQGMTLVELLVSLTIVLIVLGTASMAYLKLLKGYKSQGKIAQNYMANLTGLEMLRYDVEMAGFGLPSDMNGMTYSEAASGACSYDTGSALNDAPVGVPKPFAARDNSGPNGSDVLTIKSSVANINPTSRKSSMVMYGTPPTVKQWGRTDLDFSADGNGDKLVMLSRDGKLLVNGGGTTWTPATFTGTDATSLVSSLMMTARDVYFLYGLDSDAVHRMPFNRVDYYLDKVAGQFPSSCAASTYTLYRAVISQADGRPDPVPLLDCVRDFQVAFGLDTDTNQSVDQWTKDLGTMTAANIRLKVREVRIFVLVQEGMGDIGKSAGFRFSGFLHLGDQEIANSVDSANYPSNTFLTWSQTALPGSGYLSKWTPTDADVQYRWKVLQLAVKPLNLK